VIIKNARTQSPSLSLCHRSGSTVWGNDQVLEARGDEEKTVFDDSDVSRPEVLQVVGACSGSGFRFRVWSSGFGA